MEEAKAHSHLPEGVTLDQQTATPNQSYRVLFEGVYIGMSEHEEGWRGGKYWRFIDTEGVVRWVSVGHHYQDGTTWLKDIYLGKVEAATSATSSGAGYETNQKRKDAVERYAVKKIMGCFPSPDYKVKDVGDLHIGYDIEVVSVADGRVWHIEAKGTQTSGESVQITEGERRHNQNQCSGQKDVLCVVSHIKADPVGGEFACSGGTIHWVWPWRITERVSWDPGLVPTEYKYTVPLPKYIESIPLPANASP